MHKATWYCAVLTACLCVAVVSPGQARMPFSGEVIDQPTTIDRTGPRLSAASTSTTYGWPVHLGIQHTGEVDASFDDYGHFGSAYLPAGGAASAGVSFTTPPVVGAQYLFGGSLWIGGIVGGDTLVSTGSDGWLGIREMFPTGTGSSTATIDQYRYAGDSTLRAEYADTSIALASYDSEEGRPHVPLDVKIANRCMVWEQSPLDNALVYDMVITNIGDQTIEQGYVGYLFDADVCHDCGTAGFDDDVTGSIRESGIGYIIDNDGDPVGGAFPEDQSTPKVFAFKFLHTSFAAADTNFNWWVPNGFTDLDFGPRLRGTADDPYRDFGSGGTGAPTGDRNKYYILSHREWDYDQVFTASIGPDDPTWMEPPPYIDFDLTDGYDARFLMSIGPFDLPPDSSVRIIFTTFTADQIHVNPNNLSNLPSNPAAYEANLQLNRMVANADVIDTLVPHLLDRDLPPLGLKVLQAGSDQLKIEWDAWPEETVDGYDIFVTPVDLSAFPFPGVVAPWFVPDAPQLAGKVDRVGHATLGIYDTGIWAVNVANRYNGPTGRLSRSEFLGVTDYVAPEMPPYAFFEAGQPVELPLGPITTDHYNVYKFLKADWPNGPVLYKPFYSETRLTDTVHTLQDSITVDDVTYYYYAMTPYTQLPANATSFVDYVTDSTTYAVTASDFLYGLESPFATTVALEAPARDRGTLVLTNSSAQAPDFAGITVIKNFYASVLAGEDYAIFDLKDSIAFSPNYSGLSDCPKWIDLMPYETVILDDRYLDNLPAVYTNAVDALRRYVSSGGRLLCFGSFRAQTGASAPMAAAEWKGLFSDEIAQLFGIDSVYFAGYGYFLSNSLPLVDTVFGFNWAEPSVAGYPEIHCDTAAFPLGTQWATYWPTNTPPMIASFRIVDDPYTTPLYSYRTLDGLPAPTYQDGTIVGVKSVRPGPLGTVYETYAFGFHLYYMQSLDARALLNAIQEPNQSPLLALPGDPGYGIIGVHPQRGYDSDTYEYRVKYSDPDGDPPYAGYPRVHIYRNPMQEIAGSPFAMTELEVTSLNPFVATYSLQIDSLTPGEYWYDFEARDARAAPAPILGEFVDPAIDKFCGPFVTVPGGKVLHVTETGDDETGDGSVGNPFATPIVAAAAAANYDTILVGDGIYPMCSAPQGKALVIKSEHGPDFTTFRTDAPAYSCSGGMTFFFFDDSTTVIDGFTFRDATLDYSRAAAISLRQSSPTIRNCRFENISSPTGGAIYCQGASPLIESCAFIGNRADTIGGALYCDSASSPVIRNCTFVRNGAPSGGGAIWLDADGATIERSIISHTVGSSPVECGEGVSTVDISCTDIYGNVGGSWTGCLSDLGGINDNFSADPAYCDPARGDFHPSAASPAAPSNNSCGVLLGAYDVDPDCPGCCRLRGDVDNSGGINIADVTYTVANLFLGGRFTLCAEESDTDGSGGFDIADVTLLVSYLFSDGPEPSACP